MCNGATPFEWAYLATMIIIHVYFTFALALADPGSSREPILGGFLDIVFLIKITAVVLIILASD